MAKRFPLEIFISATDKASAVLNRLSDRIDRFNAPFKRLKSAFGEFAEKSGLTKAGAALRNVGDEALAVGRKLAIGIGVATVAFGAFAHGQVQAADAIGDTAARLNISTDALQAYQYGFNKADIDSQAFISSLDTLSKNLGLAKIGMGKALPLFRGLAIDPNKFKTIDELLPALADRLSRIHDPVKRAAIANRLLGDAGAQMAVKLGEGSKALDAMMASARAAGVMLSEETIEAASELDTKLISLRETFSGVAGNAIGRLYPALLKIAEALRAALVRYQPQIQAFAVQFAEKLPTYVERTIDALRGLRDILKPITDGVGFLVEKFGAGNTVMIAFGAIIGGKLIAAIFSLGVALVELGVSMSVAFGVPGLIVAAVAAAVAAGWWLYKNWDKVSMAIGDSIDWVRDKFASAWEWAKTAAVNAFEWIVGKLKTIWDNSPLGLLFRGIGVVMDRISSASGSTPAAAPPVGGKLLGPIQRQQVDVKVDLSNLPPGTRATATASDGIGLDLSRGFAMPGAF